MKTLPVGELKAQFSEILELVKQGESFGILYGKKKKLIAMIVPYVDKKSKKERDIGYLEGKVKIRFSADFSISEEELLGIL
ncbi:MAG: prevent-host-death protein [Spirochaetia bacterium]|jgi:antitoxin (DNA-binding transcriptional repressor) of toxin-antitoxin stability system|nr:prevent-host-death protein [Spirochaetia bacterium]